MSIVTRNHIDPVSSGEFPALDSDRVADVTQKQRMVSEFLASHRYDALLLQKPSNFSWFTSGGDCSRAGSTETTASLFITPEARVLVSSNIDSSRLFDCELPGLGFQLKERPWHEPRHALLDDLCRGRTVADDLGFGQTQDVSVHLAAMRNPITALECERMRELGRLVAHAVEASARKCQHHATEAEIAGELSHRLMKHEIVPQRIQVWADGQASRYPQWTYGSNPVERYCTIAAIGRRWGLCVGAARTICFGHAPEALKSAHQIASLIHATGMFFSQPNWEIFEIWNRIKRIYEKFDQAEQWQRADQAEVIGYDVCEMPLVPKSEFRLATRTPLHWHPSIGPAVVGDTILIGEKSTELLTPTENWPRLKVEVKGTPIFCPGILRREP